MGLNYDYEVLVGVILTLNQFLLAHYKLMMRDGSNLDTQSTHDTKSLKRDEELIFNLPLEVWNHILFYCLSYRYREFFEQDIYLKHLISFSLCCKKFYMIMNNEELWFKLLKLRLDRNEEVYETHFNFRKKSEKTTNYDVYAFVNEVRDKIGNISPKYLFGLATRGDIAHLFTHQVIQFGDYPNLFMLGELFEFLIERKEYREREDRTNLEIERRRKIKIPSKYTIQPLYKDNQSQKLNYLVFGKRLMNLSIPHSSDPDAEYVIFPLDENFFIGGYDFGNDIKEEAIKIFGNIPFSYGLVLQLYPDHCK